MTFKKAEVLTILTLAVLITISITSYFSLLFLKNKQTTKTKASEIGYCRDNPVDPPPGDSTKGFYYIWKADCDGSLGFVKDVAYKPACHTNDDCNQNTSNPSVVPPQNSNWCFGFQGPNNSWDDWRCLQLQSVDGAPPSTTSNQTTTTSVTAQSTSSNNNQPSQSSSTLTPTITSGKNCVFNALNICKAICETNNCDKCKDGKYRCSGTEDDSQITPTPTSAFFFPGTITCPAGTVPGPPRD